MTDQTKAILTLGLLWLGIQITMLAIFGIGHGGDTGRYLGAAEGLLHGELPRGKSASYIGYDLFVTMFMLTPLNEVGIVAGQLALSVVAAWSMFRLGTHLYSARAGLLAALFYIAFLKLHPWNVYILTDSLFISLIIISSYSLIAARTKWQYTLAGMLIIFTASIRPDGMAVLIAALLSGMYKLYLSQQYHWFFGIGLIILCSLPAGWYIVGKTAGEEELITHYELGAIIWSYEPLYQLMPGAVPSYVKQISSPLAAISAFIWEKPLFFIKLAAIKLWYEVIHIRPFHTPLHNFLILITVVPLYALAYFGIRRQKNGAANVYLLSLLTVKALTVAFTFADWTGRFLLHVLPIILLYAAGGLAPMLSYRFTTFFYDIHFRS